MVIQFLQKYHTDHKPEVNSVLMGHQKHFSKRAVVSYNTCVGVCARMCVHVWGCACVGMCLCVWGCLCDGVSMWGCVSVCSVFVWECVCVRVCL